VASTASLKQEQGDGRIDVLIALPLALAGAGLIYGPILLYVWMQVTALLRWRGLWLVPAALPLLVMVPVLAQTVEAYRLDSNLWPIMLILSAPGAALWLGVVTLLRRLAD
jgi:hypothetical protein